jgi:hypothetical protein
MKILCPRCGQDHIIAGEISGKNKDIFYCPECEACWDNIVALKSLNQVYGLTFTDLTTLLAIYKLSYAEIIDKTTDLV